jgi:hypothetical protein
MFCAGQNFGCLSALATERPLWCAMGMLTDFFLGLMI